MRTPLAGLMVAVALVAVGACNTQDIASPGSGTALSPTGSPTANVDNNCRYAPAGPVHLEVGAILTFGPAAGNCVGARVYIEPTDGRAGFSSNALCQQHFYITGGAGGLFKVKRCALGWVLVKVYNGGTLLQQIQIDPA
jgi:hypothetical protein